MGDNGFKPCLKAPHPGGWVMDTAAVMWEKPSKLIA